MIFYQSTTTSARAAMSVGFSKAVEWYWDLANTIAGVGVARPIVFLLAVADEKKMAAFRKFGTWIAWSLVEATLGCCVLIAACHWAIGELLRFA